MIILFKELILDFLKKKKKNWFWIY